MSNSQSVFDAKDMSEAIQLAKEITWLLKQRDLLGPYPTEDGWFVADGICYVCFQRTVKGRVYKDRDDAIGAADAIIRTMANNDIESLHVYGPIDGKCEVCEDKFRMAKEIEETHCKNCGADCGHCSIYVTLEDCLM